MHLGLQDQGGASDSLRRLQTLDLSSLIDMAEAERLSKSIRGRASKKYMLKLAREGTIPCVVIAGRRLYRRDDIIEWSRLMLRSPRAPITQEEIEAIKADAAAGLSRRQLMHKYHRHSQTLIKVLGRSDNYPEQMRKHHGLPPSVP